MTRAPDLHALNIYHLSLDWDWAVKKVRSRDILYGAKPGWTQFYSCRTSHQSCEDVYTTIYSNCCYISPFHNHVHHQVPKEPAWHWHCCTLVQRLRLRLWRLWQRCNLAAPKNMPGDEWGAPGQPTKTKFQAPVGGHTKLQGWWVFKYFTAMGNHTVFDCTLLHDYILYHTPCPFVHMRMMALWFHCRTWVVLYE